ncbi:hypothetical protein DFA_08139 [Cavenderia fasciculata]|uniref:Uncharacterized protein n=1 Tax=Cavenderia fasciculata TaxID=261658 RepID=F4Q597_CACFS|nr:uncharacterized protein DFA_08139 [Cavenderia fasciculata]EGG17156.1 hypothetical protein DFA_08139 [Cavenderia fasciculata]|eukprot:XP_004355640.1 hypothetical protein DFA_08139 [Cavenderia fasciculata]
MINVHTTYIDTFIVGKESDSFVILSPDQPTTTTTTQDDIVKVKKQTKRSSKKKTSHDDFENDQDITNFTENELKCKFKQELIVICNRLGIQSSNSQLKDTIIQQIIKQQEFKSKMVDNNKPLFDYNKGSLEYSLPWPIISRIITQFWQESSICTCYYNQQTIDTIKANQYKRCGVMWPIYLSMFDDSKESAMQCPMHRYHYLNDLDPSINIARPFTSTVNDKNKWRFQLLNISKRVNQFISSIYFDNISFKLDQETWSHLNNNQYCPIKSPKIVHLYDTKDDLSFIGDQNIVATIFNMVENLTLDNVNLKAPNNKIIPKNLTSINLQSYQPLEKENRESFLAILSKTMTRRITKLLLPIDWCRSVNLDTKFNLGIVNSNIIPLPQMRNLKTFHYYNYSLYRSSFDNPNLTTLVDHSCGDHGSGYISTFINSLPTTISTIKLKPGTSLFKHLFSDQTLGLLNLNKLLIDYDFEITDQIINHFAKYGYQYHGARFKGSTTKRQFKFIKSTTNEPLIRSTKSTTTPTFQNEIVLNNNNNTTLAYFLIEKIVRYSWNSYYCTCEQITNHKDSIKLQCQQLFNAKSICPVHKNSDTPKKDTDENILYQNINQLRFGLSLIHVYQSHWRQYQSIYHF